MFVGICNVGTYIKLQTRVLTIIVNRTLLRALIPVSTIGITRIYL